MTDLAHFSLFPATTPQILASRKRTTVQWSRGLPESQYLEHNSRLEIFEDAANGKMATWVLAPRDDPETLDFKCACETFRRKGMYVHTGEATAVEVTGFGIASVFTPHDNRGQGYARHMMRLLHWVLASHSSLPPFPKAFGEPPAEWNRGKFSVLYSDIGPSFYLQCGPGEKELDGWKTRDEISTIWDMDTVHQWMDKVDLTVEEDQWDWLDLSGAQKTWEEDEDYMKQDLVVSAKSTGHASCMFLPGNGVAAYQCRRTISFAQVRPQYKRLNKWGIRLSDASKEADKLHFVTWSFDLEPTHTTLVVTRLRTDAATFPSLLYKLAKAAKMLEVQQVEIWNLPMHLKGVATELSGQTLKREEHLPGIRVYGDEGAQVDWIFNEKFCWC